MRKRAFIIGFLVLGLGATTVHTGPAYCRFLASARNFQEYFDTLDGSRTALNPVERIVFSILLARTKVEKNERGAAVSHHRTS